MSANKQFFIRVKNQFVSVTEEVYREYYRMGRRERYLEERDAVQGRVLYSEMDTDEAPGEEMIPDMKAKSVEQTVIDKIMAENLHKCLDLLADKERELIDAIFFKGYTEREWSEITGTPQQTINDRKNRILGKLKKLLENKK